MFLNDPLIHLNHLKMPKYVSKSFKSASKTHKSFKNKLLCCIHSTYNMIHNGMGVYRSENGAA
jgi:hypothetical protein